MRKKRKLRINILIPVILLLTILFYNSCSNSKKSGIKITSPRIINKSNNQYINGQIKVAANTTHPLGVIQVRIDPDNELSALRGILYIKEESDKDTFETFEEVYFKVIERNGLLFASSVTRDSLNLTFYDGQSIDYLIDLRGTHLEDAVHTRIHISNSNKSGIGSDDPNIVELSGEMVDYQDTVLESNLTFYVYRDHAAFLLTQTEEYYYASVIGIKNNKPIYKFTLQHVHTQ